MAHVPADGPLGLEGRHELKGGDQTPPGANNETSIFMYGPSQSGAYVKIDEISGLHDAADADDNRENAEGRVGEVGYTSGQRGKLIVYTGRVLSTDRTDAGRQAMRQTAAALRRVVEEARARRAGSLTIVDPANPSEGYASYVAGARGMQLNMEDKYDQGPNKVIRWQRPFVLGVRLFDPRFIWYPQQSDLANAPGSTQVLANLGRAHADLWFDINFGGGGGGGVIVLENLTRGTRIQFKDTLDIPADGLIRIDWTQRAIVRALAPPAYNPNTDLTPFVDWDETDWWNSMEWGLGPGNNEIRVSGGSGISDWSVWWHHTSW